MDSKEITSYLSNIEEFVFDEKKIVTYSWLSKTFGIHTNISKQLLYTFFENNPKKDELCVTYLLIGQSGDDESLQVLIVQDKDLQSTESALKSITSKHIYSVQKCLELSDVNVLYAAQKVDSTDAISKGISAIDFNCNERDNALIATLKHNALPSSAGVKVVAKESAAKPAIVKKSPAKDVEDKLGNKSNTSEEKKESDSKSGNKKATFPSMFKNNTGTTKKAAPKVAANTKKAGGIGAFFSKAANKTSNEPKVTADIDKSKKDERVEKVTERLSPLKENKATLNICSESKSCLQKDSQITQEAPVKSPIISKKPETKQKVTSKKADKKRGKKTSAKKVEKDQKQRKRLVMLSESDSNNSSEEEEVQREPTPEPEPAVVPDDDDMIYGTPEPASRKRKKKYVSKTVLSDGYMVTKKELVDASCSEEEEEGAPEKKIKESATNEVCSKESESNSATPREKKESPKTKNPSPQKTKQASLMSFFKKK